MSQTWVNADMSAMLPAGTMDLLNSLEATVNTAKIPLEFVNNILNISKSIAKGMTLLDPINFLGTLASLVQQFKDDLFASGIYVCDMWGYPLKQLRPVAYGPDCTYNNINLRGGLFSETFLRDLYNSFDDEEDYNRPRFTGAAGMIVLVTAAGSISDININPTENNMCSSFPGFSRYIGRAGYSVGDAEFDYWWGKAIESANKFEYDKSLRVKRIQKAVRYFKQLEPEERSAVLTPVNPLTGIAFYTDGQLPEWDQIEEVVRSVESMYASSRYPDWSRATMRDVNPQLVDLFNEIIDPILDMLQSGSTINDSLVALISAIQGKIKRLVEIVDTIDGIIEEMEKILETTGVHALFVTTQNGVVGLKQELNNIQNSPFTGYGFYSGTAMVASGPSFEPFKAFFGAIAG